MSAAILRRGFYLLCALLLIYALVGIYLTGPVAVRVPHRRPDIAPSSERLERDVRRLCSEFGARDHTHPENLARVAEFIVAELAGTHFSTSVEEYTADGHTYRNVIAERAGRMSDAPAVLLGAHYDAIENSPGADDNASGVAVLLELARTLPETRTDQPIVLAFFGTGEPPHFATEKMGSWQFANRFKASGRSVSVMIAVDLVGYYDDAPDSQRYPQAWMRLFYPTTGNFVAVIGEPGIGEAISWTKRGLISAGELEVHSFRAPSWIGLARRSDHWAFMELGMPAVQITDTAFLRYPYYHHENDTPDRLSYPRMAQLVSALHGVTTRPE